MNIIVWVAHTTGHSCDTGTILEVNLAAEFSQAPRTCAAFKGSSRWRTRDLSNSERGVAVQARHRSA